MIEEVRDHWYWRPGWRVGRSFYTWHITFADQPEAARLVSAYEPVLAGLNGLAGVTPVPLEWLHLTLQGIGFTDRVDDRDVRAIVDAARIRLDQVSPFEVTVGPAKVDLETIQLPVQPIEPLQELRYLLRAAIADVWGADSVPELPDLNPHVTLGYWTRPAPTAPLIAYLAAADADVATLTITSVSLLNLNRDDQMYQWTPTATVTFT